MNIFRRVIVIALAAVFGIGAANAEFNWGIKAGLNVNKIRYGEKAVRETLDPSNSCGWTAGVMVDFTVPVIGIGVDASLMYARMNNGNDGNITTINIPTKADDILNTEEHNVFGKNFLEIPINLKYKFSIPVVSAFMKPYIFTGPTFAFKLDKNTLESVKSKTCQVAWNVGLGLEFLKHVQIGAGYSFGINNVAGYTGLVNTQDLKAKNNYWTVTAAYLF